MRPHVALITQIGIVFKRRVRLPDQEVVSQDTLEGVGETLPDCLVCLCVLNERGEIVRRLGAWRVAVSLRNHRRATQRYESILPVPRETTNRCQISMHPSTREGCTPLTDSPSRIQLFLPIGPAFLQNVYSSNMPVLTNAIKPTAIIIMPSQRSN